MEKKYSGIKIAVDFDGTLVKHRYPSIGEELPLSIDFLKDLQENGCKIYLDTMRSGKELEEAVEWCRQRGLEFDSIGPHRSQFRWTKSVKCHADLSIDDRGCGTPLFIDELERVYIDWERMIPDIKSRLKLLIGE